MQLFFDILIVTLLSIFLFRCIVVILYWMKFPEKLPVTKSLLTKAYYISFTYTLFVTVFFCFMFTHSNYPWIMALWIYTVISRVMWVHIYHHKLFNTLEN